MADNDKARYKVFIKATAEQVWHEISKQGDLQAAMFNNYLDVLEFKAGQPFRMLSKSRAFVGVIGQILEVDPPHRYRHTMAFTSIDEPAVTVTHSITPVAGGVEYEMALDGLVAGSKSAKQMSSGMKLIANTLKSLAETGKPGFGVRLLYLIFALTERFSPAALRAEHWPLGKGVDLEQNNG